MPRKRRKDTNATSIGHVVGVVHTGSGDISIDRVVAGGMTCPTCMGSGRIVCRACNGAGCRACGDVGHTMCTTCRGTFRITSSGAVVEADIAGHADDVRKVVTGLMSGPTERATEKQMTTEPSKNTRPKVRAANVTPRQPAPPSSAESPDVLILTAADIEYDTMIELAGIRETQRERRRTVGSKTFLDLGFDGCAVWALQCRKGSVGPGSSLDTLKDALHVLDPKPRLVINTGIAFGLRPSKQEMGDVLVAEQVRLYEIERRGTTRVARGDKVSCSTLLLSWFRDFRTDWALNIRAHRRPRVHVGLFLSGEKLSDDEAFVSELLRVEPEAIGGEMEAAGVYTAAAGEPLQHVHWAVVKGICDWGMGKGDAFQLVAARNTIDFLFHVLGQPAALEAIRSLRPPQALRAQGGGITPHAIVPTIEIEVVFRSTGAIRILSVPYLRATRAVVEAIIAESAGLLEAHAGLSIAYDLVDVASGRVLDLQMSLAEHGYPQEAPARPRFSVRFQGAFMCFPAGTRITVPGGHTPIEDVCVGDRVCSVDGEGVAMDAVVKDQTRDHVMELIVINASITASSEQAVLTDRGWVRFCELQLGDSMFAYPALTPVTVTQKEVIERQTEVFNLVVDGLGVFFANGVLVDDQSNKVSPRIHHHLLPSVQR